MKKIEYKGFFWLPEDTKHKIPGILKIKQFDSIKIYLFDHFIDNNSNFKEKIDVILFMDDLLNLFTLIDCSWEAKYPRSNHSQFINIKTSSYYANFALKNVHVSNARNIKLKKIKFNLNNINKFFKFHINSEMIKSDKEINLNLDNDKSICIDISENYKLKVDNRLINKALKPVDNISVQSQIITTIEIDSGFEIKKMINVLHDFTNFISLGIHSAMKPKEIHCELLSNPEPMITLGINNEINLYYEDHYFNRKMKKQNFQKYLFTFETIKDDFAVMITKWLLNARKYELIYHNYFAALYSNPHLHNEFLNYIQAIEGFQNRKVNQLMDEKQYVEKVITPCKEILRKNLEEELYKKMLQKIETLNYQSLRQILKGYISQFSDELKKLVFMTKKDNEFINNVCNFRNYYTHLSKKEEELTHKINSRETVIELNILKIIYEFILLKEITCLPNDKINTLLINSIKRNSYFLI